MSNGNSDGERMMSNLPKKILSTTRVVTMMYFFPSNIIKVGGRRKRGIWWGRGNKKNVMESGKGRKGGNSARGKIFNEKRGI